MCKSKLNTEHIEDSGFKNTCFQKSFVNVAVYTDTISILVGAQGH